MNQKHLPIICISCKIFKPVLDELRKDKTFDLQVLYVDSMLHMHPDDLKRRLDVLLKKELEQGKKVLLLYGHCHPNMHEYDSMRGISRISGLNCPEIMLGKEKYASLRKQGVFFLMPEWTARWREIFQNELKLDRATAREFMKEMHTKLVYLKMKQENVPVEQLNAISEYTGLGWEVMEVSYDNLLSEINKAIERLYRNET